MKMILEAACGCNIGKCRPNNEDNFYFNDHYLPEVNKGLPEILTQTAVTEQPVDFCVFDGMGGLADGHLASYTAAELFCKCRSQESARQEPDFQHQTVLQMNDAVLRLAEEKDSEMGTTASMLRFLDHTYQICNVGDSPVFLFREGQLSRLSKEHTDRDILKRHGITGQKARLTQYLGLSPEQMMIEPYMAAGTTEPGDQFLICSDGLTDMLSLEAIATILHTDQMPAQKVSLLIGAALNQGGRDNLTVIVIQLKKQSRISNLWNQLGFRK